MSMLTIEDLRVRVRSRDGMRTIVDGVTLDIGRGEALGLVGESGSGKSITARTVLGLFPRGADVTGRIEVDGEPVLGASRRSLTALRSRKVAMIFQDPRAHINPVHRVGDFLTEALRKHLGMDRAAAARKAVGLLADVGIADGERRLRQYPHELSGGLLQRVMIAAAIAIEPDLILADEPTTALDVTTQSEVMAILGDLRRERGMAMLFITHDLELAAATCDRTAVMYAGQIVECQSSRTLPDRPLHPYTSGLLGSRPSIEAAVRRLPVIPGRPVAAFETGAGCSFAGRCPMVEDRCRIEAPATVRRTEGAVACHRNEELVGALPSEPTVRSADV
ncbi:ABC transporter ATP-binding protein [Nocardioides ginsengisoli]|uniref:ABC transporter ATP-binding protein n=1 Tax=Nocardioides ginsengisoli TaxID=363868 RepID=A0ABW3VW63_9ACTN